MRDDRDLRVVVASATVHPRRGHPMNRQSYEQPETVVADDVDASAARLAANGYVILRDVIPRELIESARRAFAPLFDSARQRGANRGPHRYSLTFPFARPFDHPLLFANPAILAVLERVLGEDLAFAGMGSADCDPGCGYQPVHRDEPADLYPDAPGLSVPTFAVTVNIPLSEVDLENGPMEMWPGGTHRLPLPERLEQVASGMRSERLTMEPGSALLRDIRAWHRGTPNRSDAPRWMLGYAYTRAWFRYYYCPFPRMSAARSAELSEHERQLLRFVPVTA
jgi:ectoine hydroxylase-related dioxygenase (phytanoyl-CoA dioxygenase family)